MQSLTLAELRTQARRSRKDLEPKTRERNQAQIIAHLRSLHVVAAAEGLGLVVADDGEPDVALLASDAWARQQLVALPVVGRDRRQASMSFRLWAQDDPLTADEYGIAVPPPQNRKVVPAVIVVPLVAFDGDGNRVGRGGGYYDRYLARNLTSITVGVGFEIQNYSSWLRPTTHDVPLDMMVTELGIRYFGRK